MIQERMTLLVLILSLQYYNSRCVSINDITSTCVTLCVETASVEVFHQCHCKISEGDTSLTRNSKSKVVVEFTKWPSDDKTCEEIGRGIGGCLVRYSCGEERRCLLKNCISQKVDYFKPSMCHGEPVTSGDGVRMTCVMCTEIQGASTHIQTCNNINENAVCTHISNNMSCVLTTNPTARKRTGTEIMLYLDNLQDRQTRMKAGDVISKNINDICERIKKARGSGYCTPGVCDAVKKGNFNFIPKSDMINCRTCAKGRSLISHAVHNSQFKMFDVLLALGADVSVTANEGDNVLHLACGAAKNVTIVRTLVELGMDVEKRGYCDKTPLLATARYGDISVLKYLVDIGGNVNGIACEKLNILHLVCANGDVTMLEYILQMDINFKDITLDSKSIKGYTPLHYAVSFNRLSIVKLICERGCNLETKLFNGDTVLHTAAAFASLEMVQFIVSKNVVILDSKNHKTYTPLQKAIRYDRFSILRFLYGRGCSLENVLHIAAEFASLKIVQFIISQNVAKTDSRNNLSETPLMTAKRRSRVKDKLKIINLLQQTNKVPE